MSDLRFTIVGIRPEAPAKPKKKNILAGVPVVSIIILTIIVLACIAAPLLTSKDPGRLDLLAYSIPPGKEHLFGTDTLGRDLFACVLYGGRISLLIGVLATGISTLIAITYGSLSGMAPQWLDTALMRFTEILLSVPSLLIVVFVQAIIGAPGILSIAFVIGITSWFSIAKIIRTEVRQIRKSEYILASKTMGAGFFHLLFQHLAPNFVSAIMFMVVMNISGAIAAESTLSFMGMGLPLEIISWGSMLSLAQNAVASKLWWIILIPGAFLIITLMCMTDIGNWLRSRLNRRDTIL